MQEAYALGFLAALIAPVVAVGLFMIKNLIDLKERITILETKANFYHPQREPHDLEDK